VDEAFIELSDPEQSVAALAPEREYLLVARSLTKSFGVPGLRLGFAVTNEPLARVLNLARIPWSVGSMAAAAGEFLLGCDEHLVRSREVIREERAWLECACGIWGSRLCRAASISYWSTSRLQALPRMSWRRGACEKES